MKKVDSIGRVSKKETKGNRGNGVRLSEGERLRVATEAEIKLTEIREKYRNEHASSALDDMRDYFDSWHHRNYKGLDRIQNLVLNGSKKNPDTMTKIEYALVSSVRMSETNAVIEDVAFEQLCDVIASLLNTYKKSGVVKCTCKTEPINPPTEFPEHWDEIMLALPSELRTEIVRRLNNRLKRRSSGIPCLLLDEYDKLWHLISFCMQRKTVGVELDRELYRAVFVNRVFGNV